MRFVCNNCGVAAEATGEHRCMNEIASPLRWHQIGGVVYDSDENPVATFINSRDARATVRAINAFPLLLDACEAVIRQGMTDNDGRLSREVCAQIERYLSKAIDVAGGALQRAVERPRAKFDGPEITDH